MTSASTLPSQKHLFDIPPGLTYLNCAFMSPLVRSVFEAGQMGVARKARPWEIGPSDFFDGVELARTRFATLIGADADGVAIVPSVSYGMAIAAAQLKVSPDSEILVLQDQFPSNVFPWRSLVASQAAHVRTVTRPADHDWTAVLLHAIDERTSVVAVPACHWTDGTVVDVQTVGAAARQVGAALVVDGSQAVGAMPIEVESIQPDFLVTASYKWLMGPYSIGFAWVHPKHRDGQPLEEVWTSRAGSEDFSRPFDYPDRYRPGARRYDVGETANFVLVPMVIAAIDQLHRWGIDRIAATCRLLTEAVAEGANSVGFSTAPAELRASHLIGLRSPPGLQPGEVAGRLQDESVHVSVRGDSIRVSPHVYNDLDDVNRLVAVLEAVGRSATSV